MNSSFCKDQVAPQVFINKVSHIRSELRESRSFFSFQYISDAINFIKSTVK
jgi:hypothetical protein